MLRGNKQTPELILFLALGSEKFTLMLTARCFMSNFSESQFGLAIFWVMMISLITTRETSRHPLPFDIKAVIVTVGEEL